MSVIDPAVRTMPHDPVRVLHITWRLSATGGIPLVIRALVEHHDAARCEIHVATVRPALDEDHLSELGDGVTFHPLGLRGSLGRLARLTALVRFALVQRRVGADVIHAHSGTAVLALGAAFARRRTKRVLDVHDAPGSGRHGRTTDRLEGLLCRRGGFLPIVHSTSVRDDVARRHSVPLDRPALVPLGIRTATFTPSEASHGDPTPVVLYVARIVPTKNVDLFMDLAAAIGPRARFVVVGDGSELDRLRRRAESASLEHVSLVGPRVGTPLVEWYQRADVFVSTSDYEGFGLAVVEAMATATPVVATAVGGVTDLVVDGETGWLVPRGDLDQLVRRVEALLEDPDLAARMGAAGARRARERFDVTAMVDGYLELYERVVGEGRRAR